MIIGSKIYFFENLPSTNNHAAELLKKNNLREGTIVYTNFQTAGRGYSSNKWHSEDGKNLLFSIILFPSFLAPADQFSLSMVVSLGICDFLAPIISGFSIKWPNDIYVKNDKIAGILIENAITGDKIDHSVAGIGFNLNQENFPSTLPNPVSLSLLTHQNYDIPLCLNELAEKIDLRYKQLIAGDVTGIRSDYISNLYRLNTPAEFKDENGIFTGKIIIIGSDGRLLVEKPDGNIYEYAFKEIEFIN